MHHPLFNDEKAHGFGPLGEHKGVRADRAVEHFFCHVLYLGLAEVVEDKVVFEAAQQEGHFLILLLLLLGLEGLLKDDIVQIVLPLAILNGKTLTY